MKRIAVRLKDQIKYALVDDEVLSYLQKRKWYLLKGGYAMATIKGKTRTMHSVIIEKFGQKPSAESHNKIVIDHINQNKLDNRLCNLRLCTHAQNCMNRSKQTNNKSGFKGVCKYLQVNAIKWVAYIRINGKTKNLGYFKTPIDAAKAYNSAAKQLFGEFYVGNVL